MFFLDPITPSASPSPSSTTSGEELPEALLLAEHAPEEGELEEMGGGQSWVEDTLLDIPTFRL